MRTFFFWACTAAILKSLVQLLRLVREMQDHARRAEQLHDYCIRRFESLLGERVAEFDRPSVDVGSAEFARWYASKRSDVFNENETDRGSDDSEHRRPRR